MDFWASLGHKLRYKKMEAKMEEEIAGSLQRAADICYELDLGMEAIRSKIRGTNSEEQTEMKSL